MTTVENDQYRDRPAGPKPSGTSASEEKAFLGVTENGAWFVREALVPAHLHALLDVERYGVESLGVRHYLKQLTAGIKDPIEIMLVEQFAIGHQRLAQLYLSASKATSLEGSKIFNAAAARMQAELRRLALAIRLYRMPPAQKHFTVVEQQNVAHKQEVSYVRQGPETSILNCHDTEQGGTGVHNGLTGQGSEPGTGRLRESAALAGAHA